MNASSKQVLGCLVRDIQTGDPIGWVKTVVLDPEGEQVTELLIDPGARGRGTRLVEPLERMLGRPVFDVASRYLGEVADVVVGTESGRLLGLVVERTPGRQDYLGLERGLVWEDDHWVVMHDRPEPGSEPTEPVAVPAEAHEDWMVGQVATVRLVDGLGHVIVEPGQRITPGVVEQASRAGVLHRLEGEPH